jgi:mannose-6-phosphate isomerase-like protein (cupin superfamily)
MKVDVLALTQEVQEPWKSLNVAEVNGSTVRVRVMQDITAPWHYHQHSHEMFYVIAGRVFIDFESSTVELTPGQLLSVPPMTKHRARAAERVTLLVIDATEGDTHRVE